MPSSRPPRSSAALTGSGSILSAARFPLRANGASWAMPACPRTLAHGDTSESSCTCQRCFRPSTPRRMSVKLTVCSPSRMSSRARSTRARAQFQSERQPQAARQRGGFGAGLQRRHFDPLRGELADVQAALQQRARAPVQAGVLDPDARGFAAEFQIAHAQLRRQQMPLDAFDPERALAQAGGFAGQPAKAIRRRGQPGQPAKQPQQQRQDRKPYPQQAFQNATPSWKCTRNSSVSSP